MAKHDDGDGSAMMNRIAQEVGKTIFKPYIDEAKKKVAEKVKEFIKNKSQNTATPEGEQAAQPADVNPTANAAASTDATGSAGTPSVSAQAADTAPQPGAGQTDLNPYNSNTAAQSGDVELEEQLQAMEQPSVLQQSDQPIEMSAPPDAAESASMQLGEADAGQQGAANVAAQAQAQAAGQAQAAEAAAQAAAAEAAAAEAAATAAATEAAAAAACCT